MPHERFAFVDVTTRAKERSGRGQTGARTSAERHQERNGELLAVARHCAMRWLNGGLRVVIEGVQEHAKSFEKAG